MRINMNGIVASDDDVEVYEYFGYSAFSPKALRKALAEVSDEEELILEINSPGGSVDAGSEIYTILRTTKVHTVAEVQSLAASAASYMIMGCDEVVISPAAQMMIHLPSCVTHGDRNDHLRSVGMLDATREAILNTYELRAKGKSDRAALRQMMKAETWLTAQRAVEVGLADRILGDDEQGSVRSALSAACGLPDILTLREKYAALEKMPPARKEDWTASARLELEKNRF